MADSSKILLIGGAAAFAWWQGWLSPLGIPGPASASAAAAPVTPAPNTATPSSGTPSSATPPASPAPSPYASAKLADIYTQFAAAAMAGQQAQVNSGGARFGPDDYNFFLVQTFKAMGLPDPGLPDPTQVFGPSGWSRPDAMPIAAYWAGMSAWLSANKGMAGFRGYAGLAGLARAHGWGF